MMLTMSMLEPRLSICVVTELVAPCPTDINMITANTPMMMPSIVRKERILLEAMALKAIVTACMVFIS